MAFQIGELVHNKYRIESILGKGAFGDVYRVTNLTLNVPRVLRVFTHNGISVGGVDINNIRQRFRLEAQLGAMLNSPNANPYLLQVYDFVETNTVLILEMEYASGGNLTDRILSYKSKSIPFPKEKSLKIALEIASGLASLHKLNIVHRDLKPANILFDQREHARIGDLGMAQIPGGPSLRTLLSIPDPHPGTPGYMSPEQRQSSDLLTPSSDVYALGLLLFEMLTGQSYSKVRSGTRFNDVIPGIRPSLHDLLARMLSELPRYRPVNGRDVSVELLRELEAEEQAQKAILEKKRRELDEWERLKIEELARRESQEQTLMAVKKKRDVESIKVNVPETDVSFHQKKEVPGKESENVAAIPSKTMPAVMSAVTDNNELGNDRPASSDRLPVEIKPPSILGRYLWLGIPILLVAAIGIFLYGKNASPQNQIIIPEPTKTVEISQPAIQISTPIINENSKIPLLTPTKEIVLTQIPSQIPTQTQEIILSPTSIPNVFPEILTNQSFEDSSGWVNKSGDAHILGQYSDEWASQGARSYRISLFGDVNYEYCFTPGMRTTINQNIDLTNVNEMFFDLKIKPAIFQAGSHGDNEKTRAVVFIDKEQVYSTGEGVFGEMRDLQLIFKNEYAGKHDIKFGLMVMSKFCVKGNSEAESFSLFIDNVRFVFK